MSVPEWENAPVTYDLDFHDQIMEFLLGLGNLSTGRQGLILAHELNMRMGVSARKRLSRETEDAAAQEAAPESKDIPQLRSERNRANAALEAAILAQCPGPHKYTQHRGHQPPWCEVCRYTEAGTLIPRSTTVRDQVRD